MLRTTISGVLNRAMRVLFVIAVSSPFCDAQQPSQQTTPVDLSAPSLAVHATLWPNNMPGVPLNESLAHANVVAAQKQLRPGLDIVTKDEPQPLANIDGIYQKLTCQVDAIVIGQIGAVSYHLSANGAFIYGDYDFHIQRILKDNRAASLALTSDVVVTRPGGDLQLSGGPVSYNNELYPRFQPDTNYLVFLTYVPQSHGYITAAVFGTLVQRGEEWAINRKAFANFTSPLLARGVFESSIINWSSLCPK
jgi:hypothetical protein